tara:strand:+ start:5522 stop:5809 length:288 start_codon:yes stop_codon:yes gene_type:complete
MPITNVATIIEIKDAGNNNLHLCDRVGKEPQLVIQRANNEQTLVRLTLADLRELLPYLYRLAMTGRLLEAPDNNADLNKLTTTEGKIDPRLAAVK